MKNKDRKGKVVKCGSIVAQAITINNSNFHPFTFITTICKKKGRSLILDSVYGYSYLKDISSSQIEILNSDTDLRKLEADFRSQFKD